MTEAELGPQEQLDRRRRELNRYFKIVKVAGSSHQKPSGDAAWIAPTDKPPRDGRPWPLSVGWVSCRRPISELGKRMRQEVSRPPAEGLDCRGAEV